MFLDSSSTRESFRVGTLNLNNTRCDTQQQDTLPVSGQLLNSTFMEQYGTIGIF